MRRRQELRYKTRRNRRTFGLNFLCMKHARGSPGMRLALVLTWWILHSQVIILEWQTAFVDTFFSSMTSCYDMHVASCISANGMLCFTPLFITWLDVANRRARCRVIDEKGCHSDTWSIFECTLSPWGFLTFTACCGSMQMHSKASSWLLEMEHS